MLRYLKLPILASITPLLLASSLSFAQNAAKFPHSTPSATSTATQTYASIQASGTSTPAQSTFFSTIAEESYSTLQLTSSNGDLWPSCWADDGNLYTANGDGNGFSNTFYPMAINKIVGNLPGSLTGSWLAGDVGRVYVTGAPNPYTDKPTGMLCIDNVMYLAFQNINENTFNDAPAASVIMSSDHGLTWSQAPASPMFGTPYAYNSGGPSSPNAYLFTTIFFLDYGQNSTNNPLNDGYVYAYGLDNDWSDQQAMYLARVPHASVLDRSTWTFFSGTNSNGPTWTADITAKTPVLLDQSLRYPQMYADPNSTCPATEPVNPQGTTVNGQTVIAQGGVTFDKPLNRYIFASWSCVSHELYEAPNPWGPWSHIEMGRTSASSNPTATTDFGTLHLTQNRGQYGTSIPSKFISADGLSMYLQSNVCCSGNSYNFSLRHLYLQPYASSSASNLPSGTNLATVAGTRAISKSTHLGSLCGLNCSDQLAGTATNVDEDDFDDENKSTSWWGYVWPMEYKFNQVIYTTGGQSNGTMFSDGGWFASNLVVQVRHNFQWTTVSGVAVSPAYPYSNSTPAFTAYTFNLPDVSGDGVRILGTPGGTKTFTSIANLGVYFKGGSTNLVVDPGFESQTTNIVSAPWSIEGSDAHGIDRNLGSAHSGANNAWINDASSNWDAITQTISVQPNTNYTLSGWVQDNFTNNLGYFGVRASDGTTVLQQASFGSLPSYGQLNVTFNSGSNTTVKVFVGFWGQGSTRWIRVDDISLQ